MGLLEVRVVPRSSRPGIEVSSSGVVIRVRSVPERGRATEEAWTALATALNTPRSAVRLRSGVRSRTKVFELDDLTKDEALQRLRGTLGAEPPRDRG
jgi:uncharacterized protein YggU (UPF0235/DUF167 family)